MGLMVSFSWTMLSNSPLILKMALAWLGQSGSGILEITAPIRPMIFEWYSGLTSTQTSKDLGCLSSFFLLQFLLCIFSLRSLDVGRNSTDEDDVTVCILTSRVSMYLTCKRRCKRNFQSIIEESWC